VTEPVVCGLGRKRRAIGASTSQTRAPRAGIVAHEGSGFIPTLELGGGVGFDPVSLGGTA
jgi:hypothetical protein